jgi:hypothetical protein
MPDRPSQWLAGSDVVITVLPTGAIAEHVPANGDNNAWPS